MDDNSDLNPNAISTQIVKSNHRLIECTSSLYYVVMLGVDVRIEGYPEHQVRMVYLRKFTG